MHLVCFVLASYSGNNDLISDKRRNVFAKANQASNESGTFGKFKEGLPSFSLKEISNHTSK